MISPAEQILIEKALKVRANAYAPYSGYQVGCALQTVSGLQFTGCNMENASYTPTICAERVAIGKMVSEGEREIQTLVVVTPSAKPTFPCGVCLQVIGEFGSQAKIIAVTPDQSAVEARFFKELFPFAFLPKHLREGQR